jgi:Ser/Thr protein kinase RdoA (MazF antagonist)
MSNLPTAESRWPIAIRSSVFDEAALAVWLEEVYDLPELAVCTFVSLSLNDTYRVESGDVVAYLRIGRPGTRSLADVDIELAVVRALGRAGLPVALPLVRRDGEYAGELLAPEGLRPTALIAEAPGGDVREITPEQSRVYGRLAARVHHASNQIPPRGFRPLDGAALVERPLAAIRDRMTWLHADRAELAELESIAARIVERLAAIPRTPPAWGFCHGDLHPGNVRFDDAGQPTLFDFDCCGAGWRAYDLAVFQWNAWLERRDPDWIAARWEAFLAGYHEVRELSDDELAAVPLFLVARQIWLMGLDASLESGYPPQWVGPEWLPAQLAFIRGWVDRYPILQ